jgi:hypothetical protein
LLIIVAVLAVVELKKFVVAPGLLLIVVRAAVFALKRLKMPLLNTGPAIEPVVVTLPSCSVPKLIMVPPL